MATKVLMLNPPYFKKFSRAQRSPAVTKSGCIYYPMWLAYATGVLEKNGFDVKLIDAPGDDYGLDDVLDLVRKFKPDLCVVDTSTPSIYNDVMVAVKIKEVSGSFITLVGTHVSALPDETFQLSSEIDAIARHEYDYTLLELAERLAKKRELLTVSNSINSIEQVDLSNIAGLSYRRNEKIFHNPDREYIKDLDELPFVSEVYKRHLRIENYFYGANRHPVVTILSGRGCPHRCIYCVFPQTLMGRRYRYRGIRNVVDELEYIKETFPQVKEVFLEDDTLTVNRERCLELADEILARGLKITWSTNSRADVNIETLKAIKKAGCRLLCVGFESGAQQVLDGIRKHLKIEQSKEFMKNCKQVGLLVHGCFLYGMPGETWETMEKTLKFAIELNPDTVQFFPIMVYPGTKAYEWAKENGYLETEDYSQWLTKDGLHNCVVSRPGLTNRDLVDYCDYSRRAFYFRPRYVLSKATQAILHPKEAKRIVMAAKTSFWHLIRGSLPEKDEGRQ